MNYLYFLIFFISLKEISLSDNWDNQFMDKLSTFGDEYAELELYTMLDNCVKKPKSFKYIDNLCDAIRHYRSESGKTVIASSDLIENMKEFDNIVYNFIKLHSYKVIKNDLKEKIKEKILDAKNKGKKRATIKNAPDSCRSAWYLTLGSYTLNIEYNEEINTNNNLFYFNVHFFGEDLWDFEEAECKNNYDIQCFLHNYFEEKIPKHLVGEGKPFYVSYDFYDEIEVNTN